MTPRKSAQPNTSTHPKPIPGNAAVPARFLLPAEPAGESETLGRAWRTAPKPLQVLLWTAAIAAASWLSPVDVVELLKLVASK